MVVVFILPRAEFGPNDHRVNEPHFIQFWQKNVVFLITFYFCSKGSMFSRTIRTSSYGLQSFSEHQTSAADSLLITRKKFSHKAWLSRLRGALFLLMRFICWYFMSFIVGFWDYNDQYRTSNNHRCTWSVTHICIWFYMLVDFEAKKNVPSIVNLLCIFMIQE